MPGQERHHLRAGLQDRHVGVEIDPSQALDIQRDMPIEHVVHRDDPLHIPPACAHRGAAATPRPGSDRCPATRTCHVCRGSPRTMNFVIRSSSAPGSPVTSNTGAQAVSRWEPPQGPSGRGTTLTEAGHRRILTARRGDRSGWPPPGLPAVAHCRPLAASSSRTSAAAWCCSPRSRPPPWPALRSWWRSALFCAARITGSMPGFDDRVEGGAWQAHRLGDGKPLAGALEGPGGVFAALVGVA